MSSILGSTLARNVVAFRQMKGLTQEQLAEMTDLSLGAIKGIEAGKKWPRASSIEALAKTFEIDPRRLLWEDPFALKPGTFEPPDPSDKIRFKSFLLEFIAKAPRDLLIAAISSRLDREKRD